MRIVIISSNFPTVDRPWCGTFVFELCQELVRQEVKVLVIAPESIWGKIKIGRRRRKTNDFIVGNKNLKVCRPLWLSLSNIKIGSFSSFSLSNITFWWAIKSQLPKIKAFSPNICYGHFLYCSGIAAYNLGNTLGIPKILSLGESSFNRYEVTLSDQKIKKDLNNFDRIVCVSQELEKLCMDRYGVNRDKVLYCPNGVDTQKFHPMNKVQVRKKLGFPLDKEIAIFVGHFDKRKGVLRVLKALKKSNGIKGVFVGSGDLEPSGDAVIFKGRIDHAKMPDYLSSADMMILPSLREGMSNAIIEAMACGLPIITSNKKFNKEFLDDSCSILVNPESVDEISSAIQKLANSPDTRQTMGEKARKKVIKHYSLKNRATSILNILKCAVKDKSVW